MRARFLSIGALAGFVISTNSLGNPPAEPKNYPDLDGTVWAGKDLNGKSYEVTFHSVDYKNRSHILSDPSEGVEAGHASMVTNPDQPLKAFTYDFVGPAEVVGNHGDDGRRGYNMRFSWYGKDGNAEMKGLLVEDQIHMDYVEPHIIAIDYKALLGEAYKGRKGPTSITIDCAGQDVNLEVGFYSNDDDARQRLEYADASTVQRGPFDLGELSYFLPDPLNPSYIPTLYVTRENVLLTFTGTAPKSPDVTKRILEVAHILDSAIHEENPAVTVIRMPKILSRTK